MHDDNALGNAIAIFLYFPTIPYILRISYLYTVCKSDEEGKDKIVDVTSTDEKETPLSSAELVPQEILMTLFAHLSPKELMVCSAVCKSWREVALR